MLPLALFVVSHISPLAGDYKQPQLAVSRDMVAVTFGSSEDIYFANSADNGRSFSDPAAIAHVPGLNLGNHRGPRIAITPQAIVISAVDGREGGGGNLLAWRSTDHGKTWSGPATINDVPKAAREGLHAMAAGPNGVLYAIWLDLRHLVPGKPGTELYGSYSTDGGKTWSKNITAYNSPSGTICQCCHPSLIIDDKGTIHAMWRNVVNGDRDLYVASSTDGGRTFGPAQRQGAGTWRLEACPMDGGGITVTPDGTMVTTWRREREIFLARSGAPEARVGEGKNPTIAANRDGVVVIWSNANGIEARVPGKDKPLALDPEGSFPQAITLPNGKILATWEHKGTLQFQLF